MSAWDDLLDEFRALGGAAENIRLGHGQFGRGIFPIDPGRPISIRVPDNLLVAVADMVFIGGRPRVALSATANARERAWLDRYQGEFAWGGGGNDEVVHMFEMAGALPEGLRQSLLTKFRCGDWFEDPTEELIQRRFFEMRAITYNSRMVLMPLIELINHGHGPSYNVSNGVAVTGTFPGEVFVHYSNLDSLDYFRSWGFATQRPVAFSIALQGRIDSARLRLWEGFKGEVNSERSWIPELGHEDDALSLSFLLIGNSQYPKLPKAIFYQLMRSAGHQGFEEAFDIVHHLNRLHFIDLLQELEGLEAPIAQTLRTMARCQLRAMSFCFGVQAG